MRVLKLASIALACGLLTACVGAGGGLSLSAGAAPPDFHANDLLKTTVKDLQAADADAGQLVTDPSGTHVKDPFADQCYKGAIEFLKSEGQNGGNLLPPAPVGVFSTFQDARDVVKGVFSVSGGAGGPLPATLVEACGPLALDVQNDIGHVTGTLTLLGVHF